jgi:hypothetical protein
MKAPLESGKVSIEDIFVHDSTDKNRQKENDPHHNDGDKSNTVYDLK